MPITRGVWGAARALLLRACVGFRQLTSRWKSLYPIIHPLRHPGPLLLCFLCSLSFIFISRFNLLSMSCMAIKEMLSMQSSKYVNMVCSSPHLGVSGDFWLFVKHFCFSKVYLSGFHIITLVGQTLNRSRERVLRGAGGRECSSMDVAQPFFCKEKVAGGRRFIQILWNCFHTKDEK